jgi:hypothetical protein
MAVLRTDIEKGLDEIITHEEGKRFQALAVMLARQKYPDLIASEYSQGPWPRYLCGSVHCSGPRRKRRRLLDHGVA